MNVVLALALTGAFVAGGFAGFYIGLVVRIGGEGGGHGN